MGIAEANELMSIPWQDLAGQFTNDINTRVNCMVSDEWNLDTGKKTVKAKIGGQMIKVGAYRVQMRLNSAEFVGSIASAPGFLKISPSSISAAARARMSAKSR